MLGIPTVIIQQKNKLYTPSAWLVLLEIELESTTLRFVSNNEDVTFDGNTFSAMPFELDESKQSSDGEIPSLTLKVCNVTQVIQGYLEALDGGVGSSVTIRVVNSEYLTASYADLEMTYNILGTSCDAEWITFSLGAENPLRRRFPPDRYIATYCNWQFKEVECGYSGEETTCARTFDACSDYGNTARFGGFLGLSQKGWIATG